MLTCLYVPCTVTTCDRVDPSWPPSSKSLEWSQPRFKTGRKDKGVSRDMNQCLPYGFLVSQVAGKTPATASPGSQSLPT
ncbi:hypothetical protein MTO96_041696 [Rhipicephalus appendiculatus]